MRDFELPLKTATSMVKSSSSFSKRVLSLKDGFFETRSRNNSLNFSYVYMFFILSSDILNFETLKF